MLPHTFRPSQKVLVFASGSQADAARAAGADIVGGAELLPQVLDGSLEFDVCLSTPALLKEVKTAGRVLRQKSPSVKKGALLRCVAALRHCVALRLWVALLRCAPHCMFFGVQHQLAPGYSSREGLTATRSPLVVGTVGEDIGRITGQFKGGISYGSNGEGLIAAPFGKVRNARRSLYRCDCHMAGVSAPARAASR